MSPVVVLLTILLHAVFVMEPRLKEKSTVAKMTLGH